MPELTDRAVEVLRRGPGDRWTVGSGFLVGRRWVLSAAHNVLDAGVLLVRLLDESEHPAEPVMIDEAGDIALLAVSGDPPPVDVSPVRFARVDRSRTSVLAPCWTIGYPRWKERERQPGTVRLRESAQVDGEIPTGSNLRANLLELRSRSMPRPVGGRGLSEWQGMSGAVVFAEDQAGGAFAVGVVSEHHAAQGNSVLTVVPLDRWADAARGTPWGRDLGLDALVDLPRPTAALSSGHTNLRRSLPDFTDRDETIARAKALLTDRLTETCPLVVLHGMAGVGKTELANELGHRLAATFTHARIRVDVAAAPTADAAMVEVLAAFEVSGDELPREPRLRRIEYQKRLRRGPSLLLLDNVSEARQAEPLLPESPGTAVIVTSRSTLASVDGADRLRLEPLPDPDGLRLFERIVGPGAVAADRPSAERIVELLAGLPLAIRIAGAQLVMRRGSLARYLSALMDETRRISRLEGEDRGVRGSFELSYRSLRPDTARLFRHLGVLAGGDFTAAVVARAADVDDEDAERMLGELTDRHLAEVSGEDRYRLHDLLRLYAKERLADEESPSDRRDAFRRSLAWYGEMLHDWMSRPGAHEQPPEEAIAWFADESLNVQANLRAAADAGEDEFVVGMAESLYGLLFYRAHWEEMEAVKDLAVAAARRLGDAPAELGSLIHLAEARRILGRGDEAPPLYERALEVVRSMDDPGKEAWVLVHFGDFQCDLDQPERALDRYAEAQAIYRARDDAAGEIWLAAHIADAHRQLGRYADAARVLEHAMAMGERRGDRDEVVWCAWHLALAYDGLGRYADAVDVLGPAVAFHRETESRKAGLATMLTILGDVHRHAGRPSDARTAYSEALDLLIDIDAPSRVREVRERLADLPAEG
ncbi:tetratricopeptide repeat protein [Actinomadura syzygii]|uniref:Tetratricopeptide repeat protein n=1 Tax=Actinomadura syzygii TaxID=1427538 RepID=A0A5D0TVT5_9ACTN|nr:tetratricopeptide repeat protein [Actinomadura syzygii]TYC09445.1 tetratricopeptide repeat protein [Actinomadura syzygii]